MTEARKGQTPGQISRAEFGERYQAAFRDLAFEAERTAIERLEQIAERCTAITQSRRVPAPSHVQTRRRTAQRRPGRFLSQIAKRINP